MDVCPKCKKEYQKGFNCVSLPSVARSESNYMITIDCGIFYAVLGCDCDPSMTMMEKRHFKSASLACLNAISALDGLKEKIREEAYKYHRQYQEMNKEVKDAV